MTVLGLFAIVYGGMAITHSFWVIGFLFFLNGIYAAATEGIAKAWISNMVPPEDIATAIGSYSGFQSICGLIASSLAGIVWYNFGSTATFLLSALVASGVLVYLYSKQSASR
jgi:sugar phosphate permease